MLRQVWNTTPNDAYWILGVFRNGRRLNPGDRGISDRVRGTAVYDLYGADSGYFKPGQRFLATATFADGSTTQARAIVS